MKSDALVVLLKWELLVPWKVLSLPKRVADDFAPVGYGSKSTVFRGRARQGSTLWVVTRPVPESLHPPSLVARLEVQGLYNRENCPTELRSPGVDGLFDGWPWVAVSKVDRSDFFELNDATEALRKLRIRNFSVPRSFPGGTAQVHRAFEPCMQQAHDRTVFLSYTHEESREFALELANGLRDEGFSPWLDSLTIPLFEEEKEGSPAAERLSRLIRVGLHRSQLAIVVSTRSYGNTRWTHKEREWIQGLRKTAGYPRCVEITRGAKKLRSYDKRFDDGPPGDLASQIADWWREYNQGVASLR